MAIEGKSVSELGRADGSSVSRTVLNLTMSAVGTSVFALPASFSKSGFVAVAPLLVITWALSQYMMSLLYKCMLSQPGTRSYTELGFAAGGRVGKLCVSVAMYLGLGAICVAMILLMASATASMSPSYIKDASDPAANDALVSQCKIISAGCMGLLALLPTFKEVGIVSGLGVVALLVTLVTVITAAALNFKEEDHSAKTGPKSFMEICGTFNMFMNGFTIAPVIPSLVLDMREPGKFGKALFMGYGTVALSFLIIGYTYLGFGDLKIQGAQSVTELVIARGGKLATLVQWATIVICICHFLCLFAPIAAATDNLLKARTLAIKAIARLAIVGLCLAGAFLIPKFGVLIEIVACTIVPLLQLVYPIWLFVKLLPDEARKQRTQLLIAASVGFFAVVVGMILAVKNIAA